MNVDQALIINEGCIRHTSQCFICDKMFEWYAPFDMSQHARHNNLALGEIIAESTKITDGRNTWADVSIKVNCTGCGVRNKYRGIKIKLK